MNIIDQLKRDEGVVLKPYKDSVGKLTIGIGRNLDDVGIDAGEADFLLRNDVLRAGLELSSHLPWTDKMDDARRGVLLNMCFNMGIHGLLTFRNTLRLIEQMSYTDAAVEMLKSKWAEQVGARAHRLAKQLETGEWQ